MRVAWFSPAAGNSGIVEYTRHLLPALARRADVELWSWGAPERQPSDVRCVDYAAEPAALYQLDKRDVIIYNLGNHLGFHRAEYEASKQWPGVVVLHDRTLHHFFAGYYVTHLRAPGAYVERMRDLYGERGNQVAQRVIAQLGEAAWEYEEEVLAQSFVEDALAGSLGAVVHSANHAEHVRSRWSGPVCQLAMPAYDAQLARAPAPEVAREDGLVTLMSIGHVDRNKHVLTVVETLAADQALADRVRYVVIGQYDARTAYIRDLNRTIADAGLARRVQLLGYQPAATLERHAATADVFLNLRYPNLESGSASLMEQLARGRAVLVFDSGSYADLPDEVAVKVRPMDRVQLTERLRELVADREQRLRLGRAARTYAEGHRVEPYAEALLEFARLAHTRQAHLRLAQRVDAELEWLDVSAGDAAREQIKAEIDELLG